MEKVNFYQVIEDSQVYSDLDQIKRSLEMFLVYYERSLKSLPDGTMIVKPESIDIPYIIKGIQNTIERGYNIDV